MLRQRGHSPSPKLESGVCGKPEAERCGGTEGSANERVNAGRAAPPLSLILKKSGPGGLRRAYSPVYRSSRGGKAWGPGSPGDPAPCQEPRSLAMPGSPLDKGRASRGWPPFWRQQFII